MTESKAIEELKNSIISYEVQNPSNITCDLTTEVLDMAIKALEKQEKIKEAFTHYAFSGFEMDVLSYCLQCLVEIKDILKGGVMENE